ncbi:hypothetical protein EON66_01755 [archaeon]|nr:MAG: hypothetical protein EON66_01755 [archaeon]
MLTFACSVRRGWTYACRSDDDVDGATAPSFVAPTRALCQLGGGLSLATCAAAFSTRAVCAASK